MKIQNIGGSYVTWTCSGFFSFNFGKRNEPNLAKGQPAN
jgi:hypothetical protein